VPTKTRQYGGANPPEILSGWDVANPRASLPKFDFSLFAISARVSNSYELHVCRNRFLLPQDLHQDHQDNQMFANFATWTDERLKMEAGNVLAS
jgi:hypothetical protein